MHVLPPGYLDLLGQLTTVGEITEAQFSGRWQGGGSHMHMHKHKGARHPMHEDVDSNCEAVLHIR